MNQRHFKFTLLGTGSSGGVPRVGGDWGACDPSEPKNRRTRCSALVETWTTPDARTTILIDTSPDMREQLLSAEVTRIDAVLFTHDHADQTHGIDDIRALAIRNRAQVAAFMDEATSQTLLPKFRYVFEGDKGYPPIYRLQPYVSAYDPVSVDGPGGVIETLPLEQEHGKINSLGFRFGNLAYCNDVNGLPKRTLEHLQGLDVLVLDALRYTPHPSHANLDQALEWISELKPRRAVLTNLHVDLDYQTLDDTLPKGVEPGFDGWAYEAML